MIDVNFQKTGCKVKKKFSYMQARVFFLYFFLKMFAYVKKK